MVKKLFLFLLLLSSIPTFAQHAFQDEVDAFASKDAKVNQKDLILFTGSSTLRLWSDLENAFPGKNVINRGFGGSTMADLVYYFDDVIAVHKPTKIFIYEGDNDLAAGVKPDVILAQADYLVKMIRSNVSAKVPVAFFSAKPSLARWSMKAQYEEYNQKLKAWAATQKNVSYIDTWTPMLDANGEPQKDIFKEDGLHMNKKGYDIWVKVLSKEL